MQPLRPRIYVMLGVLGTVPVTAVADVIRVPGDYPTIQGAIDAAKHDDGIVVAPGVYGEAIDLQGKRIALYSSDGPQRTVIDAGDRRTSAVTCVSGETVDTIIQGFTISGGSGTADEYDRRCGGGLYLIDGGATVIDCWFVGNHADYRGGGVYVENGDCAFRNCRFLANVARFAGGGLYCGSGACIVEDTHFVANTCNGGGGGASCGAEPTVFKRCTFADNAALNASALDGHSDQLLVEACLFSRNFSTTGATCSLGGDDLQVTHCRFVENRGGYSGGGLRIFAQRAQISECDFQDCTGVTGPGAVFVRGRGNSITRCRFIGNTGAQAGGVYIDGNAQALITECLFRQNAGASGAVRTFNGDVSIERCEFDGNTGISYDGDGGAVGMRGSTTDASIVSSRFTRNIGQRGGAVAMFADREVHAIRIENCLFVGNSARNAERNEGAAVYVEEHRLNVVGCTIDDNESRGGEAIQSRDADVLIANTILRGWLGQGSLVRHDGSRAIVENCNVEGSGGSGANWDARLGEDGGGNIDAIPMFVDALAGDYRLRSGSPCIDAGAADLAQHGTDLNGCPRLVDDAYVTDTGTGPAPIVDIGAYEWQALSHPTLEPVNPVFHVGVFAKLLASHVRDRTRSYLAYSVEGVGSTYLPRFNVTVDLDSPTVIAISPDSTLGGTVEWGFPVPGSLAGRTIWVQAVQLNLKSDVVRAQVSE